MAVISNKNMQELLDEERRNAPLRAQPEEPRLLDGKGRLLAVGRSAEEPPPFERSSVPLPHRLTRLKEIERFTVMSDSLYMFIAAGEIGWAGFVTVSVINRYSGYQKSRTRLFPFTFGSMEMPPSPSSGDLIVRKNDVSLDFSRSPDARHIRCRFDDYDDVRELYVNLELELPPVIEQAPAGTSRAAGVKKAIGEYYSLRETGAARQGGFVYSAHVPCMRTAGTVVLGADRFVFSGDDCFSSCEWTRGVLPRRTESVSLTACGGAGGSRVGISLSPAGMMLHDSDHMLIAEPCPIGMNKTGTGGVRSGIEYPALPVNIASPDGRLRMRFIPSDELSFTKAAGPFASCGCRLIFGTASGSCRTDASGAVGFSDIYACLMLTDARW